jgi:cell wall-associated NlpC family hydrolase
VLNGRKRTAQALATLCITALSGSMLASSPAAAEPDIDDVQQRVDTLYAEAEQASERFNDARIELTTAKKKLSSLRANLDEQQAKVAVLRDSMAASVVDQYQGQALTSATQVMLADDPDAFLDELTTISGFNEQRAEMIASFADEAERLEKREKSAKRELAKIAETKDQLADEQAEIEDKAGAAEALLGRLEDRAAERAAARAAAVSRSQERSAPEPEPAPEPASAPAASGSAGAAVSYAMAQVGDAYVYGAAGPDAFDCSGLMMMAWKAAGVSLPHSSSAQMSSGTPVSQSQLQPGDLVFYYSPVSHVGMYIGNGQIVHASNPSSPVNVAPVDSMPYSGAVRPG